MSRIGRNPIQLPRGVEIKNVRPGRVEVKGPKGVLNVDVHQDLGFELEDGVLTVTRQADDREQRAQHGLARALVSNAVIGVSEGYTRDLEIHGVGFRCQMKGRNLELNLGFSHPVVVEPPEGVTLNAPEPTRISVSGIDKQAVGQVAANIRALRPPDAYHGKGVRYAGEQVRLKPGKAAAR